MLRDFEDESEKDGGWDGTVEEGASAEGEGGEEREDGEAGYVIGLVEVGSVGPTRATGLERADGEDGGPYLLTARLYEEDGKRHRLVAQWTGYADTFLNLTSNLRGDRRVSREGLFGMLADRLKESLCAVSDKRNKNDYQEKPES